MSLFELFIIAVGLSADAFAAAICKGLSFNRSSIKNAGIVGLYFGVFQAGMPLIGYFVGGLFHDKIAAIDHWAAFVLLGFIGIDMIRESRNNDENMDNSCDFRSMSVLAVATSIDALAVGVTFAFLQVNIVPAVLFIGIITFIFSAIGVKIGNIFGIRYKSKAEFIGGLILVCMGIKILLEHTGVL